MFDAIYKISEGVPGAMVGITKLMESDEAGFMLLLGLDDMNIRGSQVWEAYKYLYNEDAKKFAETVKNRDKNMVDLICREKCLLLWKSTEAVAVSIIRGD